MLLLLVAKLLAATPAHDSYEKRVSANGYGAVVWNEDRLSDAFPHLYQEYSPAVTTPEVLYDSYFGVTDENGRGAWLTNVDGITTDPGSGIVIAERSYGDLAITEYDFVPMQMEGFGLAQVAHVVNRGASAIGTFQLVLLLNWHVGGTETVVSASAEEIAESGSDVTMTFRAPGATDVSCAAIYEAVLAGQRIGAGCNGDGADMVPGFGWTIPTLEPGEEIWIGSAGQASPGVPDDWIAGRDPEDWVTDERGYWEQFQAQAVVPDGLSTEEGALFQQSLVFLKMGQVRETGAAYGQIPASLPLSAPVEGLEHIWNITWVRDSAYAAAALSAAGYPEEAAAALRFLIQPGKAGGYVEEVGSDYAVSVCRVYGDGAEWSDEDENGPNVELDNFGLFLWALGETAEGDPTLLADVAPTALDGVADVLITAINTDNGLLQADSSIWERHWNGQQKQFVYSSAWAVKGLRAAAEIANAIGDGREESYRQAADGIAAAIDTHAFDADGAVGGSLEELSAGGYRDLSAVEVFNLGIVDAGGPRFTASLGAWDAELRVASGNGYHRNDDGSTYDEQEWPFVDLRLAEALRRSCRDAEADALVAWVTEQAALNGNIVPELLDPDAADYAGPAPMLGFGAGAYVLALAGREAAAADCADGTTDDWVPGGDTSDSGVADSGVADSGPSDGDDTGVPDTGSLDTGSVAAADSGGEKASAEGCGCGASSGKGAWLGLVAWALVWLRRGRPA